VRTVTERKQDERPVDPLQSLASITRTRMPALVINSTFVKSIANWRLPVSGDRGSLPEGNRGSCVDDPRRLHDGDCVLAARLDHAAVAGAVGSGADGNGPRGSEGQLGVAERMQSPSTAGVR
jgi:hypothetical protein